jgi:hypothetical protein
VGFSCRVAERHVFGFVEAEIAEAPGRENQLARKAQLLDGFRAIFAAKGAKRSVVLAQHEIGHVTRAEIRIVLLCAGFSRPFAVSRPGFQFRE